MNLITCGYQGLQSKQFFDLLATHNVQTLVDVRELSLSRKPGFSKSALATSAARHGLRYVHLRALGCPRDIRNAYRANGDWASYAQRFQAYLDQQGAAIAELAELARHERCCLLCFEADAAHCHRSFVAQRVAAVVGKQVGVEHLKA